MKKLTGLAWGAAMFAGLAGGAHAGVQEGVEAWRTGDYARAVAEWQPLAEAGDPDAEFNLGQAYKLGRGVEQDLGRAEELFGQAAQQGHREAEANYGLMLFQDGRREEAMPWIVRAAERGEPRAQYIYGTALFNGDFAPRDWARGYAMMRSAAEAGVPQAAISLEQMERHLSNEQREQGIALAETMAAGGEAETLAAATPAPPPPGAGDRMPPAAPPATARPAPATAGPAPADGLPPAAPPATAAPATAHAQAEAPPAAPPATARSGGWRIQLGAFREGPRAEQLWQDLSGHLDEFAGLQPYLVRAGPYTRLQAGPFRSEREAEGACAAARRGGAECFTLRRP